MFRSHSVVSGAAACLLAAAGCASSTPNNEHGPSFGSEAGTDASQEEAGGPEGGSPETGGNDAGTESGNEGGGPGTDGGPTDAGREAAPVDAPEEPSPDAPAETGGDGGFVAPTCDGVIGPGEYGTIANEQSNTSTGQVWYMTWDATNLYVAIDQASVAEGSVIYVALAPGDGGSGGLTTGYAYDNTDVTSLPFGAGLVVYAHGAGASTQQYAEARVGTGGVWGTANSTAVQVCTGTSSATREEVIPWSLVGGIPGSFGWLGYVAAAASTHPQGYIYGQMPSDDPGGAPANAETYTKYYAVPNATPGVDTPFADEQ